jgi:hypothetical protein
MGLPHGPLLYPPEPGQQDPDGQDAQVDVHLGTQGKGWGYQASLRGLQA